VELLDLPAETPGNVLEMIVRRPPARNPDTSFRGDNQRVTGRKSPDTLEEAVIGGFK
jgi:hypothetical protein